MHTDINSKVGRSLWICDAVMKVGMRTISCDSSSMVMIYIKRLQWSNTVIIMWKGITVARGEVSFPYTTSPQYWVRVEQLVHIH